MPGVALPEKVVERALATRGGSSAPIYEMVRRVIARRHLRGGTLVDVGCGRGELFRYVQPLITNYLGADVVRYAEYPSDLAFTEIEVATGAVALGDQRADIVTAVETIEHVENPRAFFRELCRLAKPGALIIVTTPNQLSLLSLLTLFTKGVFNAFQEAPGLYPSHITALLEIDLGRIARECGLKAGEVSYSDVGRLPFTSQRWPSKLFRGRYFSDNLLLSAICPAEASASQKHRR